MYFVVESFSVDRVTSGLLSGVPVPSVIEDADGGYRWLLVPDGLVITSHWENAYRLGAMGVLSISDGQLFFATTNSVMQSSGGFSFSVPSSELVAVESLPSSSDLALYESRSPIISESGFVHLHAHSEFSPLDGLATVQEMVDEAVRHNQSAIAVTDHGVCAAHPELAKVARRAGIKPVFGIEANFVNHRRVKESVGDYYHLILWAQNERGLRNLWSASSEAYRDGFYGRARMDWDTLSRNNDGVMCSTACLRGPLSDMILDGDEDGVRASLSRLQALFGDRLYVELHTNQLPQQRVVNEALVQLAQEFSLPTIAVADSHYACQSDHKAHKVWIAAQTNKSLQDEGDLFAGDEHYHISSVDEIRQSLSYLPQSVVDESIFQTSVVADLCNAGLESRKSTPVFHRKGEDSGSDKDARVLRQMCLDAWSKVADKPNQEEYVERLEEELDLLVSKKFCGYILLVADYCRWCKENMILMGPGRGSAAGSLVCYLTGITEVDPIDARLLFERFLTPGRTSLPDIDSDFPASKRDVITQYIVDRWGEDRVVRVGTHIRLANRGVMRDLARVLRDSLSIDYRDVDAVSKIIEDAESGTAGLGLSWDELWGQVGDELSPYQLKYPEWFEYADKFVGRLKSYGKHAAGVVIDPERSIIDRLPLRGGESEQPITEFAMEDLEELGYVKFDLLTLRTLDTIQVCLDSIREDEKLSLGSPNIYEWNEEYNDPQVWDMLCEGETLGVFQIETSAGTKLTKRFKPRSIDDLCAILTLVRPGPIRSGLTETYLSRRSGSEPVLSMHPLLDNVLDKTYQTMIYQEDIMAVCRTLGGYTTEEADEVRSILGKKKVDKVESEGRRFISRCVENGVESDIAIRLWDQMQEFARYAFNRSHSWSYALLAYWTAWLKCHYPVHFSAAVLSTVKKERIPQFVEMTRRMGYQVLPPDINESKDGFTISADRMSIRYGLDSVKNVGSSAMQAVLVGQPYESMDDFLERKGRACHMGHVELLAQLGAFDKISGMHRAQLEQWLSDIRSGKSKDCAWKDESVTGAPNDLPCTFDWATEVRIGKSGKPLKTKPVPKRCGKTCRNYTERSDSEMPENVPVHSDALIRNREMDMLGVYLSSTPFDDVDNEVRSSVVTAHQLESLPTGTYITLGIVTAVRKRNDKANRQMAFVDILTEQGTLSTVTFSGEWARYHGDIVVSKMMLARVKTNKRGTQIIDVAPII